MLPTDQQVSISGMAPKALECAYGQRRSVVGKGNVVQAVVDQMAHKLFAIAQMHCRQRPLDLLRMWHDKIEACMLEQVDLVVREDSQGTSRDKQKDAAGTD